MGYGQGQCGHCGYWHDLSVMCPRIKRVEYFPNGSVKEIEYHSVTPNYNVLWPTQNPDQNVKPQ